MTTANRFYNILRKFNIDDAFYLGSRWYPNAWDLCCDIGLEHNVAPKRVAAVMAVTSPRARWSVNVDATRRIVADAMSNGHDGKTYGIIRRNETKAIRVMSSRYYSNIVVGPKVSAFYDAICGDTDVVTVDSIMSQAAGHTADVTPRIREEVITACWQIGEVFGLTPRDAQAAVWCAFRGSAA